MEDILASIRRIIAEDQSNNLGRSGLGGLTRRQQATPTPVTEEASPAAGAAEADLAPVSVEADLHAGPQADTLHHAFETPSAVPHEPEEGVAMVEPVVEAHAEPSYDGEVAYGAHDREVQDLGPEAVAGARDDLEPLMSPTIGASITSSFQTLAESVMLQDPDLIERVLRESMRPLLKAWLDDHLPSIVERLVRTEIERVARGGRARSA